MRLTDTLYKTSGLEYGTCSNTYTVDTGDGLVMIDAGTHDQQFNTIRHTLERWALDTKPITHVLLTHTHFDHAGNAARFQKNGAKLVISRRDGIDLAEGGEACLERIFGLPFQRAQADILLDGETELTIGNLHVRAIPAPGHTAGSMVYLLTLPDGARALSTGDMLAIPQTTPQSQFMIDMGWTGSPGFDRAGYLSTIEKLCGVEADLLLTGHWGVVFSDTRPLMRSLLDKAREALKDEA